MTKRVLRIDEDRCMGHGLCYASAPELLNEGEDGFVAQRGMDTEVPEELEVEAALVEGVCPEGAITLLDG